MVRCTSAGEALSICGIIVIVVGDCGMLNCEVTATNLRSSDVIATSVLIRVISLYNCSNNIYSLKSRRTIEHSQWIIHNRQNDPTFLFNNAKFYVYEYY